MDSQVNSQVNCVEVIRDELRYVTKIKRNQNRIIEWNKCRAFLDEVEINETSWDLATVIAKSTELKKKPLSLNDYLQLQTALIQNKDNIKGFLSVDGTIPALIRDFSHANPEIKLAAAHCCCNITLAKSKQCFTVYKYAGPYIVEQLETLSNPLLETCAWTVGNLSSGSKNAFKSLYAQGCINRLLSLLRQVDTIILPSIIYAITHCLYGGSEIISNTEALEMAKILIERSCYNFVSGLWALALLSSKVSCRDVILTILPLAFNKLVSEIGNDDPDTILITAVVRLLANSVTESSGLAADVILKSPNHRDKDILRVFDKLLLYPHIHVRKETLWLIGNLYYSSQVVINEALLNLLNNLSSLKHAVQTIN